MIELGPISVGSFIFIIYIAIYNIFLNKDKNKSLDDCKLFKDEMPPRQEEIMINEIKFLSFVVKMFNLFDQKKRNRVLEYLNHRYYKKLDDI